MKVSHKWLQSYFKKPIPSSEDIAKLLTFHIFEVEGIEKKADDDVLDVKVLPDRASYCLSHEGIARELSALITDNEFEPRNPSQIDVSTEISAPQIVIEAKDVCSKFCAVDIIGLSNQPSPAWLKERLEVLGQRSINLLVDLTNFVMLDIGRPLHVFDAEKVKGAITVRYAKMGEALKLLGGKDLVLDPSVLVLSDEEAALDIANIKGGDKAEMDSMSRHVILVALNTIPSYIRKTSAKLGIKTDSSKRFENGVDEALIDRAINHFLTLLSKEDPDAIFSSVAVAGSSSEIDRKLAIDPKFISEKLGKSISVDEIISCLSRGSIPSRREGEVIAVYPPSYRSDLNIVEDVVDEVGRLYGYENVEALLPKIITAITPNKLRSYQNKVRNFLVSRGYSEIMTYTLKDKGEVEIANPLASDKSFYRSNLHDAMVEKLEQNLYYADLLGLNKIKLFEFGHVYKDGREYMSLSVGIKSKKAGKGDEELKVVCDELFKELESNNVTAVPNEDVVEIDFEMLINALPIPEEDIGLSKGADVKYKPFSAYPFIVRDVALFTSPSHKPEDVFSVISRNASDLLVRHDLFDVFEKKSKESGETEKISYAFRLVFQSFDRTLTDDEVQRIMDKIHDALKGQGWEVR